MADFGLHSLVLAADYRVPNVERMWSSLVARESHLAEIGAHHVLVYGSAWDTDRVLVTIGVRNPDPVPELMRSPVMFEWFDVAGVDDIPAIFAGEVTEKLDLTGTLERTRPGFIVAAMASVDDIDVLIRRVREVADRFVRAGVRKVWIYRAFDNPREVLILQDLVDEPSARRWVDSPDEVAEWMSGAGHGAYPPVFVGRVVHILTIDGEH